MNHPSSEPQQDSGVVNQHKAATHQNSEPTSNTDQRFVRLAWWQTVLSVVGVLIAVIALYAALIESRAVRQQTAAAVWPFVQLAIEDFDTGEQAGFSMGLTNVGVGPAKMQDVKIILNGVAIRDSAQLLATMNVPATTPISRNFISRRVLRPDETVVMFSTHDVALVRKLQSAMRTPQNAISYCYCSIFEDCWLADSQQDLQSPKSVERCPDFGVEAFNN